VKFSNKTVGLASKVPKQI